MQKDDITNFDDLDYNQIIGLYCHYCSEMFNNNNIIYEKYRHKEHILYKYCQTQNIHHYLPNTSCMETGRYHEKNPSPPIRVIMAHKHINAFILYTKKYKYNIWKKILVSLEMSNRVIISSKYMKGEQRAKYILFELFRRCVTLDEFKKAFEDYPLVVIAIQVYGALPHELNSEIYAALY